jgi:hypothetical protein
MASDTGEVDITDPDFDPKKCNISTLLRLLTKYDVDLPPSRQKKDFYVSLTLDNLNYMRKQLQSSINASAKKAPSKGVFVVPKTPASQYSALTRKRSKRSTVEKEVVESTPVLSFKKRAIIQSDVESTSMFSDDNPFQSPAGSTSKTKKLTKQKFTPSKIAVPETLAAVDTQFSPIQSPPVFKEQETPTTLSEILSKKSPSVKSPPSSRKKTPKKVEFVDSTPSKPSSTTVDDLVSLSPAPPLLGKESKKESLQRRILERKKASHVRYWRKLFFISIAVALISMGFFWREVKSPSMTYCLGDNKENCYECPKNAVCEERKVSNCISNDFRLHTDFFSYYFGYFLGFPFDQPKCVWDSNRIMKESKKQKQVEHLVQVLDIIVREFVGKVACDSKPPSQYKWIMSSKNSAKILGMPVELAKEELVKLVNTKWTNKQLEEYWSMVLDKLQQDKFPLTTMLDDTVYRHRMFTSTNPPVIPFSCKLKRQIVSFAKENAILLSALVGLVFVVAFGIQVYNTSQYESSVVAQLLLDVMDAVHAELEGYEMDSQKHPIPGLPVVQLRDYFLPRTLNRFKRDTDHAIDENNRVIWYVWDESSRNRIWKRVHKEITKNSNIRETNTQVKGESHIVWMWIGSSVLSPKKRSNSNTIFGTVSSKVVSNE